MTRFFFTCPPVGQMGLREEGMLGRSRFLSMRCGCSSSRWSSQRELHGRTRIDLRARRMPRGLLGTPGPSPLGRKPPLAACCHSLKGQNSSPPLVWPPSVSSETWQLWSALNSLQATVSGQAKAFAGLRHAANVTWHQQQQSMTRDGQSTLSH